MKKFIFILPLVILTSVKLTAQKNSSPYLDNKGNECVLTWNSKTGTSKLLFYKESENKFKEAAYLLPVKPTGDEGTYGFKPYVDAKGNECVLTWNSKTGTSKLFFYKESENKFKEAEHQIPVID